MVALLGGNRRISRTWRSVGWPEPVNLDSIGTLNLERLMYIKSFIDKLSDFVEQVYKSGYRSHRCLLSGMAGARQGAV